MGVPFTPLVLSGIEHFGFGTHYVEDLLRAVGLHEPLGDFYEPLLRAIEAIFG